MSEQRCWCGRPVHNDLLDGCVGDGFLRMLFGPPALNALIFSAISMYGDLLASATEGDAQALAFIAEHPMPGPDIETDKAMLRMAGMDVSDDDIRSLRAWYNPGQDERVGA